MTTSISISPKYTSKDWAKLKFHSESDWDEAARMLEDRIEGRFFEVVERIRGYGYAGFAILALDCLLIETLEQFYRGVNETPRSQAKAYFQSFLTRTSFGRYFTPKMADDFYVSFRCGILHQAEIKDNSLILRRPTSPLVKQAGGGSGLEINRNLFHGELVAVFRQYPSDLRNPANTVLRQNFRNKMNYICNAGAVC